MKNKFDKKIQNLDEVYKKVLKIKKNFEKILDKLYKLDFTEESDLIKSMLKLSKILDEIILKYDYLLDKGKSS